MHESIGGGQISAPTSATNSSSSSNNNNNEHRVDDMPIEHTSFGGSAQDNNTAKSLAEQMAAHRRVRINFPLYLFFLARRKILNFKLNGRSALFFFFLQLRQIVVGSSQQRRGARTDLNIVNVMVGDRRPKVCICSSKRGLRACSLQNPEF